jgi:hypothetical protein
MPLTNAVVPQLDEVVTQQEAKKLCAVPPDRAVFLQDIQEKQDHNHTDKQT